MGKKKRQKTKELSVAIAEAASKGGDTGQQQETAQPQAPRKRGRPRKVAVETESEEKKKVVEEPKDQPPASTVEEQHGSASASACTGIFTKEEGVLFEDIQLPKEEPSRSRARRKSKPRKST